MIYRFNENINNIPASASLSVSEKAKDMRAQGIDIITLATGEPDFDTPSKAGIAGIAAIAAGKTHYSAARGILPLRQRISQKLTEENSIPCSPENILMAPGGKYAIYEAIRALITPGKGQEVMILNPAWVSYAPVVHSAGGVPVAVELAFFNNYKIEKDKLESCVSPNTRLLIINYPNNPTGCILSEEEAAIIADFACAHDLLVISDEIYEAITFDGKKSISMASLPQVADRVITVNGFSKSVAMTGWRLGYLCAPVPVIEKIFLLTQHTISCLSDFAQEAALASLDCRREIMEMTASYEHRRDFFVDGLSQIPCVTCHKPAGAFYAWAKFDLNGMSSNEISTFLLEKAHVATVSGDAYGLGGSQCIRMSFATAETELKEALIRISTAIHSYLEERK